MPTYINGTLQTSSQSADDQLDTLAALTAAQVGGLVDLATLEAPGSDGQFIVATGSGVFAYESGSTALASIGGAPAAGSSSIVTTGALDTGSITDGFGTITAGGIIKTESTTNATTVNDGSIQTDGGLSVKLDAVIGDDLIMITDGAVLSQGIGADVKLTHDGTTGGTLSGTPMVVEGLGASSLASDTHSGIVLEFLAGESLAVGDWVYVDSTDARVSKADANDTGDNGHYPAIGVAVSAQGSAGSAVKILTHGTYNDSNGFGGDLTEGNKLYLSETAGGITATAPSDDGDMVQVVGIAIGPRDVFVNPSLDVIEHD